MCKNNPDCGGPVSEADIIDKIERFGWGVMGILASPTNPGFVYTVGLTGKGLPELLAVADDYHDGYAVIEAAAALMVSDSALFVDGSHITVPVGDTNRIFHVVGNTKENYRRAAKARSIYGPRRMKVTVLQLVDAATGR